MMPDVWTVGFTFGTLLSNVYKFASGFKIQIDLISKGNVVRLLEFDNINDCNESCQTSFINLFEILLIHMDYAKK